MSAHELHLLSRAKMFNGHQEQYRCFSKTCQTDMTFGIYLPPQVLKGYPAPVLYFLSGLHGDGSELIRQTGIQRFAAQWNIIVVFPDTSPRGSHISDSTDELIGHGALSIALKNPGRYAAVSAFVPLCHPTASRGGKQAFAAYLGAESEAWQAYDSTSLVQTTSRKLPILIDQGGVDPLFPDELQPEAFVNAARANGFNVQYKVRPGYGHDYFFIASFIDSHIEFHAEALGL